jgi:amino acid transporter
MSEDQRGRFGTFEGVFTPNILTILGLILFLRTGWVVGQAGMINALTIVLLSAVITLVTGLSLSVIATSLNVGAGGTYFVISRTLGAEAGGSIGIPLYLSQAVSVAFYIIGFTDAFVAANPEYDPRLTATVVAAVFALMAWVGADFAFKVQNVILVVLGASIFSFFAGGWGTITEPLLTSGYTKGENYWTVFAVFFPAVTGIAVGASMSGDLKNPAESIPKGTLYSIGVSTVVYVLTVIWIAFHADRAELLSNNLIVKDIAYWPGLIFAGIYAATLSSALGSILAAPRTLEALATDKVVPERLRSRIGSKTEPRMAILLTTGIALVTIWAGDLDVVAPVITMFFLNTYGVVNLAAGVQLLVDNPSFRPSFKLPWWLPLAGALGCYGTMFLIHTPATIVAIVVSIAIYVHLERRSLERTWGDVRSGFWFALARRALVQLDNVTWHVKNWRPSILVFTGQPHNREHLVEMAEWLSTGKGIVTFVQLVPGDTEKLMKSGAIGEAKLEIERYIRDRGMQAFGTSIAADSFVAGSDVIMQSHGVGGLSSNAILMGMGGTVEGLTVQMHKVRRAALFGKSVMMLRYHPERGWGKRSTIDVWWGGMGSNAPLMLLLAHLVETHRDWTGATIRLLQVVDDESKSEASLVELNKLLEEVRVKAEPKVLVKEEGVRVGDIIRRESTPTDLTLLGLQAVEQDEAENYAKALLLLTQDVGSSLIVHSLAGGDILQTS